MSTSSELIVNAGVGLHARPAAEFVKLAQEYTLLPVEIVTVNDATSIVDQIDVIRVEHSIKCECINFD